jgi:hypothetical protein
MVPESGNRFRPYLVVLSATTAMGALSSSLGGPVAATIGAVAGFAWALIVGLVSSWLGARMPEFSRRWLFSAAFIATTLFGGSLFAMLLYVSAATSENILTLIRPPFKGGFTFFVT